MPNSSYLTCLIALLTVSAATGNYGYGQQVTNQMCNHNAYNRAKEMIRLEIQQRSNSQPPYNPQYPPLTNSYQGGSNNQFVNQLDDHKCQLIRQGFDDLLINTPLCDGVSTYQFQSSADLIQQGRNFLAQYCERNQGWRYLECFRRREMLECENKFNMMRQSPSSYNYNQPNVQPNVAPYNQPNVPYNQPNAPVSFELCQAFETFRNCVVVESRIRCRLSESEHIGTYLVDKAHNAAWSCIPRQTVGNPLVVGSADYRPRTDVVYPNPNSAYPPYPPYGQSGQSLPTYQQGGGQPYQPLPSSIDRMGGALAGIEAGSIDKCIIRVRPYENACLDHLVQRQREARYGRSSNDVQRRICCALFYYRDCLSRVVLERCFEHSKIAVDILMGDRNREITNTCRDITRDQCNGTKAVVGSWSLLAVALALATIINRIPSV